MNSRFILPSLVFPVRAFVKGFVVLMDDVSRHPEDNGIVYTVGK